MNREYAILEAYIKNVCKGIKDKTAKNEIRDELLSHMLEIYDRNIALGLSHDDAQRDVVSHMGDSENISNTFKELYPVSIKQLLKSDALTLVYPLIFLYRNFIYLDALSLLLLAVGLKTLKSVNKWFDFAYKTSIAFSAVQIASFAIHSYYGVEYMTNNIYLMISQIIISLIYVVILIGIIQSRKNYFDTDFHLYLSIILMVVQIGLFVIGILYDSSFEIIAVLLTVVPGISIYTSVSKIEDFQEINPLKVRDTSISQRRILIVIILLIAVASVFIGATRQPETKRLNNEDLQINVSEITTNLLDLGLPENVVSDLPQSEIAKYENASKIEVINDEDHIPYTVYVVQITTENQPLKIRVLLVVDDLQNMEKQYRDELYIDTNNLGAISEGDAFFRLVSEKNNRKEEIVPFKSYTFKEYMDTEEVYAFNFGYPKNVDSLTIYAAQTVTPKLDEDELQVSFYYHHTDFITEYLELSGEYSDRINGHFNVWFDNPLYQNK